MKRIIFFWVDTIIQTCLNKTFVSIISLFPYRASLRVCTNAAFSKNSGLTPAKNISIVRWKAFPTALDYSSKPFIFEELFSLGMFEVCFWGNILLLQAPVSPLNLFKFVFPKYYTARLCSLKSVSVANFHFLSSLILGLRTLQSWLSISNQWDWRQGIQKLSLSPSKYQRRRVTTLI